MSKKKKVPSRAHISHMLEIASRGVCTTNKPPHETASWLMNIVSELAVADEWEPACPIEPVEEENK